MTPETTLLAQRFVTIERLDSYWFITFTDNVILSVECLWRLLEGDKIVVTSEDHGHQFGLPAPVDALACLQTCLASSQVTGVDLREGTNDLRLVFASGHMLEIIPTSRGYEMWHLYHNEDELHAVGGKLNVPLKIIKG
jgi:hypothetical protein